MNSDDIEAAERIRQAADLASRLGRLEGKLELLVEQLEDFVTKARFYPVELIAYGLVGGVLLTVLGSMLLRVIAR